MPWTSYPLSSRNSVLGCDGLSGGRVPGRLYSQVGSILAGDACVDVSDTAMGRHARDPPLISATFLLLYSSGGGRSSLMKGACASDMVEASEKRNDGEPERVGEVASRLEKKITSTADGARTHSLCLRKATHYHCATTACSRTTGTATTTRDARTTEIRSLLHLRVLA